MTALLGRVPSLRAGGLALVGAIVLGLVAVPWPTYALVAVLGVIFVVLAFASVAAGAAALIILSFFELLPIGDSNVTTVKLGGAVLLVAWILELVRRRTLVPELVHEHPVMAVSALGLVAWAFSSTLWAPDTGAALSDAFRLTQGVVVMFIVASAVRERRHVYWLCGAYVAGAALTGVIGLSGATSPETVDPYTDPSRLTGGIGDPNELAAVLLPGLWIALLGLGASRALLFRWLFGLGALAVAVSLFYTQSRGGLVGLGLTFLVAPFAAGRARARVIVAIAVLAGVGLMYYALVATPEAVQRITHFTTGGGTGRTSAWSIAVDVIADHPITGAGTGNFAVVEPSYAIGNTSVDRPDLIVTTPIVVHNTYLHVFAELGVVGIALAVAIFGGSLLSARLAIRRFAARHDADLELLARGIAIGFVGMLGALAFISGQHEKQLWMLIGLLAALPALAPATARERSREPPARPRPVRIDLPSADASR